MIGTTVVDDDDMIVEYVTGQVVVVTVWIEGCGLAKFGSCKGDGTPGWILAIGRKIWVHLRIQMLYIQVP